MNTRIYSGAACAVAGACGLLVWFSTLQGPGTTPDSLQYLFAAQDLLGGTSVRELSRHWPPGYPLLITLALQVGGEPEWALRISVAVIAVVDVLLFSACVRPLRGEPTLVSLLATLAFALSPGVLSISVMALSEPAFLAFLLSALLGLRAFLVAGSRGGLVFATTCLACAVFTRYTGMAFAVLVGAWLCMAWWKASPVRAILLGVAVCCAAILPLAVWLLAPADAVQGTAPRTLAFHPADTGHLVQAGAVAAEWFRSHALGMVPASLISLCSLGVILRTIGPGISADPERRFVLLCLLAAVGYAVFLLVSISFFDFYTPVDTRTLLPALVMMSLGTGIGASRLSTAGLHRGLFAGALVAVPLLAGLPELSRDVSRYIRGVPGYFNPAVSGTPLVGILRNLPAGDIHSNAPELVRLVSGHAASMLPAFRDDVRNEASGDYVQRMETLFADVRAGRAVVVYFAALGWRAYLPDRSVFEREGVGVFSYDGADGWMLVAGAPAGIGGGVPGGGILPPVQ